MCFSATASFGASAVLGVIGVVSLSKAKTKPQKLFGTIPLLFSIQQLTEGLLWISLRNTDMSNWLPFLTYTFLVFAMAVWPFWIPFTIHKLETDEKRKRLTKVFAWIGAFVAIGVCFILFSYPVKAVTPFCLNCPDAATASLRDHLHYEFAIPTLVKNLIVAFSVLYIAATIVTPFISTIKKMKWLGVVFLTSYLFAVIFYTGFVISVWCFFAAILSFVVLWIILDLRKTVPKNTKGT